MCYLTISKFWCKLLQEKSEEITTFANLYVTNKINQVVNYWYQMTYLVSNPALDNVGLPHELQVGRVIN